MPAAALFADSSYILYSFYLYLIPLVNLIMRRFKSIISIKLLDLFLEHGEHIMDVVLNAFQSVLSIIILIVLGYFLAQRFS